MTTATRRILYVDADEEARLMMQALLAPYRLDATGSDEEARVLARRHSYDVYILTSGADASGLALCAWLHRIDPRTPIIYCSSNASAKHQGEALASGALRYHVKPLDPNLIKSTLGLLLKLADIESRRAQAAAELAVEEARAEQAAHEPRDTRAAGARAKHTLDCQLRVKAYRAFRDAGGNRANFERFWPAGAATKPCGLTSAAAPGNAKEGNQQGFP
jgi:DNA-binding response OmpR family regulator